MLKKRMDSKNTLVKVGIDQISQLSDKEKEYNRSPEERYERRLGEEKLILKALSSHGQPSTNCPESPLTTAMNYLLPNRDGLTPLPQRRKTVTFQQHRGKQHPAFYRWAEKLAF